jgi:hypothetical protein
VKSVIEKDFNLDQSTERLTKVMKEIIRVNFISILSCRSGEYKLDSNIPNLPELTNDQLKKDFTKLAEKCTENPDISKYLNKLSTLEPFIKNYPFNYCVKEETTLYDEKTTLLYIFHLENASLKPLMEK